MRRAVTLTLKNILCGASLAACAQSPVLDPVPDFQDASTQVIEPSTGPRAPTIELDAGNTPIGAPDAGGDAPLGEPAPDDASSRDADLSEPDAMLPTPFVDAGALGEEAQLDATIESPDTGPSVPSCAAGTSLCGSACVDLTTDVDHCGDCATRCTGTPCVAAACTKAPPAGCTAQAYGGHSYLFCTAQLNWIDARDACRKTALDLTVIDNAAENDFVRGAGESWIGASDIDGETKWRALAPGVAARADGPLVTYSNWAPSQPNNTIYCAGLMAIGDDCLFLESSKTDEDCALMLADGRWDDAPCTVTRHYVCESY